MNARTQIINTLCADIARRRGGIERVRYVEIGIFHESRNYGHIQAGVKLGCDPAIAGRSAVGILPWTSRRLFAHLRDLRATVDIVFVDGDHSYQAVHNDVASALGILAPRGYLVMHDCLPTCEDETIEPRPPGGKPWTGGAYRVWRELVAAYPGAHMSCLDTDHGVGVLRRPDLAGGLPALDQPTAGPWALDDADRREQYRIAGDLSEVLR